MTSEEWRFEGTHTSAPEHGDSQERLRSSVVVRALLAASGAAILLLDDSGRITWASESAVRLFDCPRSQLLGLDFDSLTTPPGVAWQALLHRLNGPGSIATDVVRDLRVRTPSGREIAVELRLSAWADEGRRGLLAAIRDTFAPNSFARSLLSHNEPLHQIVDHVEDAFYIRALERNRLVYSSSALERIMGASPDGGTRSRRWLDSVHPGDRQRVQAAYHQLLRGDPFDEEYRVFREDGRLIWVHDRAFVVRSEQGEPLSVVGVLCEITERRDFLHELEHAQRVEVIGTLAASIAHDMGNILAGIGACADVISRSSLDRSRDELIQEILRSVDRGTNYVGQLLDYCRRKTTRLQPVVVSSVVRDVATLISTVLGEKIVLRVDNAAGEARVDADPVQLEQVIMNLVLNAKDAIEDTGEIDLSTRVIDTGAAPGASSRPGSWVEVSVRDDGCGISPEGREHLFEPFFTTKERGHGLGLSMADTIVRRLGGSIEVDSKPGEGATFTIRLPQRP